jgi:hypothetical protein
VEASALSKEPQPEPKAHHPAICIAYDGVPFLTNTLYVSGDEAFADLKELYIRLATEIPAIWLAESSRKAKFLHVQETRKRIKGG